MTGPDWAKLISLLLTVPTILLAVFVVMVYWQRAREGWKRLISSQPTREVDWLVMGIVLGFSGALFDNIYWMFAWSADFIDHSTREFWFTYGPLSNVPFRQLAGILAAILHLYPVVKNGKTKNVYITVIAVFTLLFCGTLLSMRSL